MIFREPYIHVTYIYTECVALQIKYSFFYGQWGLNA